MIVIETPKALDPGKVYALRLEREATNAEVEELCDRLRTLHEESNLHFIVLHSNLTLIEVSETATLEKLLKEKNENQQHQKETPA